MVFYAASNISDSSHYSGLSWVSPVLGWGSEVSCPRTLPQKPRGSSAARTQEPWITSQTPCHQGTQDPDTQLSFAKIKKKCFSMFLGENIGMH